MAFPPLVPLGRTLRPGEIDRYSRQLFLPELGEAGQRRLIGAKVAVVGVGGLGSPALQYLAAAGVGTLGLIDFDAVEASNLHRQPLHFEADIGRSKLDSAADKLAALAPGTTIVKHEVRLNESNVDGVLSGYDLVLDGADNFPTRYLVDAACARLGLPLVWASVFRGHAQVSVFWSAPPTGAPRGLRDLFPTPPEPGSVPSCAEGGVIGALCGQVGSLMATETIKLICGIGEPLFGRVLVIDSLAASWRQIPLLPRTQPTVKTANKSAGRPEEESSAQATSERATDPVTPARSSDPEPAPPLPAIANINAAHLAERLEARADGRDDFVLVDVREKEEFATGAIPGAILLPLAQALTEAGRAELGKATEIIVYCARGPRAQRAALDFSRAGFTVSTLEGGIHAWNE